MALGRRGLKTGKKKVEGNYDHDQPDGEFIWWHTNGQKAVQAAYARGKQEGPWIWWHDNGLKAISGMYVEGKPSGRGFGGKNRARWLNV